MTIWPILRPLEIFYCHLVYFVVIWYIFLHFGILHQEKSGNPGRGTHFFRRKLILALIFNQGFLPDVANKFRVTRLGQFSPNGRLFSLGSFLKAAQAGE
jgi:hypothetical protein